MRKSEKLKQSTTVFIINTGNQPGDRIRGSNDFVLTFQVNLSPRVEETIGFSVFRAICSTHKIIQ